MVLLTTFLLACQDSIINNEEGEVSSSQEILSNNDTAVER